jgi:hypothetical protein
VGIKTLTLVEATEILGILTKVYRSKNERKLSIKEKHFHSCWHLTIHSQHLLQIKPPASRQRYKAAVISTDVNDIIHMELVIPCAYANTMEQYL